ncbi:MAG: NADPH-dependent glutamate synthase [Candidatus Bathyarchaeota archaeon]|nr:NADPH-dependent glutamate synthase [Candidatus Bathyarchaeota archaeon]
MINSGNKHSKRQSLKRPLMRKRPLEERVKDFNEVALGFNEKDAIAEAKRCLQCAKPQCIKGCPVEIDIPFFIKNMEERNFDEAIRTIKNRDNLPAMTGRVCPQETQCEAFCILPEPIAIGSLERFAADYELKKGIQVSKRVRDSTGKKIAVIGSGPAGLSIAGDLAKLRHNVTIFEALHKPGGVLIYGIPEFRLSNEIVKEEIEYVKKLGVEIETNIIIGKTLTIDELFDQGYDTIFIGSGAGSPHFLGIEGENLVGVYSANEFLTRSNLMKAYKFPEYDTPIHVGRKVIVIGGGNVAMDSARTALRYGANVSIIYRRTEKEMPARIEEVQNAHEEGIQFEMLTNPIRILGDRDKRVCAIECVRMKLGEPDESGRRRPIEIPESNFIIDADTIIIAIGQGPNPLISQTTKGLETNEKGYIIVDENGRTSRKGVWAAGDIVPGEETVIEAMGGARRAAIDINNYLMKKKKYRKS